MSMLDLETPASAVDSFQLPCGYLDADGNLHTDIEVVGMTGDDEETLAARNMPVIKKMNRILSRCTKAIGPYREARQIEKIIPELTQGDRMYLLIAIRRVSLGDMFPFIAECPKCEHKSNMNVDLSTLEAVKMTDPKIRTYEIVLGKSNKKLNMKVLTGHGEEGIAKAATNGKDLITVAMLVRIDAMDGGPPSLKAIRDLSLADRNQIRDSWQDHEGGIDTEVECMCSSCDAEFKVDVDIGSVGFFNPLALSRASKTR